MMRAALPRLLLCALLALASGQPGGQPSSSYDGSSPCSTSSPCSSGMFCNFDSGTSGACESCSDCSSCSCGLTNAGANDCSARCGGGAGNPYAYGGQQQPAGSPLWTVVCVGPSSGGTCPCAISTDGACWSPVASGSSSYDANVECAAIALGSAIANATGPFGTEANADVLVLLDPSYDPNSGQQPGPSDIVGSWSGTSGPSNVLMAANQILYWRSDGSVNGIGFTICGTPYTHPPSPPATPAPQMPVYAPGTIWAVSSGSQYCTLTAAADPSCAGGGGGGGGKGGGGPVANGCAVESGPPRCIMAGMPYLNYERCVVTALVQVSPPPCDPARAPAAPRAPRARAPLPSHSYGSAGPTALAGAPDRVFTMAAAAHSWPSPRPSSRPSRITTSSPSTAT